MTTTRHLDAKQARQEEVALAYQAAVTNLRAVMAEETGQDQITPLVCQADTYTTGDEVWDMGWRLAHLYRPARAACEEASA